MADTDRLPVVGSMRVNNFAVLERAVEEGIQMGWHRAHKYNEEPDMGTICEQIRQEVMGAICEVFEFDEPEEV